MDVLYESVHTPNWFKAIWEIMESKGGWKCLSKNYKEKTMLMSKRTLLLCAEIVLDKLEATFDFSNKEDCEYFSNLLQHYDLNCDTKKLIVLYNKLVKSRLPLEHTRLLENIMKDNPEFVCQELKENVRLQLLEKESKLVYRIEVGHDVKLLYEKLLRDHHNHGVQLLVCLLYTSPSPRDCS